MRSCGIIAELSTDIHVITAEINAYQRVAGEAIFEIGRRLKHVKENDLAHGEFGKWLESIGLNHRVANQMMKIYVELPGKWRTSSNLGAEALYQIATMPEAERTQPQTIPSTQETKTVDEMTVQMLDVQRLGLRHKTSTWSEIADVGEFDCERYRKSRHVTRF